MVRTGRVLRVVVGPVTSLAAGAFGLVWFATHTSFPATAPPHLLLPNVMPPASARDVAQRSGHEWGGWRVLREVSVNHVAVIDVEAHRPANARLIAEQVLEPYTWRHIEVLIYFVPPEHRRADATLRLRWTPTGGIEELSYPQPAHQR
jgi:hypothetical protein